MQGSSVGVNYSTSLPFSFLTFPFPFLLSFPLLSFSSPTLPSLYHFPSPLPLEVGSSPIQLGVWGRYKLPGVSGIEFDAF